MLLVMVVLFVVHAFPQCALWHGSVEATGCIGSMD